MENIRAKYSKRYYRSLQGVDTSVAEMERQAEQLEEELERLRVEEEEELGGKGAEYRFLVMQGHM